MHKDDDVHRRTATVLIRHGSQAADFAAMIAAELARSGDSEGSETWLAVSKEARALLSDIPSASWPPERDSALPVGRFQRRGSVVAKA